MKWQYTKGLHDLGNHCYAYLQPDGSWGWSNAGLIAGEEGSLLVDTLFDVPSTREMLDALSPVTKRASIETLVNTHSNGDHCWGNELLADREIIASTACRDQMLEDLQPGMMADLVESEGLGAGAEFLKDRMGGFDFRSVTLTPPTRVFDDALTIEISGRRVELVEVGPAHTRGDVLVYVPEDRTIFTGDILFIEGTPILWEGPIGNWVKACDYMLDLELETVVPGHGPITDKSGIRRVREYLLFIEAESRRRYEAGMSVEEAARDIALGEFAGWGDAERIAVNVGTLYREFAGGDVGPDLLGILELMAELAAKREA